MISLCLFLWLWIKTKVLFVDINDSNIIAVRFSRKGCFETHVRTDVFQSFNSALNVSFALLIANFTHHTKVFIGQVKKLEKAVGIAIFIALLLAVFGVMCAMSTTLPPGL